MNSYLHVINGHLDRGPTAASDADGPGVERVLSQVELLLAFDQCVELCAILC